MNETYAAASPSSPKGRTGKTHLALDSRRNRLCKVKHMTFRLFAAGILITASAFAQTTDTRDAKSKAHNKRSKHDIISGVGDIGKGAGRGAISAAKGTGKAAGDLVTLHPINAATDLGKGAAGVGKNVGVGTVKGTGKIIKGTGKAIKHLF